MSARILMLFALCATSALAQSIVDTPVLSPNSPLAGQPVNVELHGYACVLYLSPPDTPFVVTRNGSAITLLVQAVVSPDQDFCIYPVDTTSYAIGMFAPGNYTVTVQAQYENFFAEEITQTLGVLLLNARGPMQVPALSTWGASVLAFCLFGVFVWRA